MLAALGEPTLSETAPVILRVSTPDTGFLVGLERVLQTFFPDRARRTDADGLADLGGRHAGGPDRKEKVGVGITAGANLAPVANGEHRVVSSCLVDHACECECFHMDPPCFTGLSPGFPIVYGQGWCLGKRFP